MTHEKKPIDAAKKPSAVNAAGPTPKVGPEKKPEVGKRPEEKGKQPGHVKR